MLTRLLMALTLLPLAVFAAVPQAAAEGPTCTKTDPLRGTCVLWAGDDGGSGSPGGEAGGGGSGGGGGAGGGGSGDGDGSPHVYIDGMKCMFPTMAQPQPPASDPIWEGRTEGAIYTCMLRAGFEFSPAITHSFWAAQAPAPAPPDPEELAREAVAAMGLGAIDIGIVPEDGPGSVGVVGMPTWMWAEGAGEATFGPITRTASAGGFTVTATASVSHVVWTMGDGTTVTCDGAGTPYADSFGKSSSPDCGHTYTRQGRYTVGATSYWNVEWEGIGESGTIPLDFTNTTTITMGEIQVITQ